MENLLEKDNLIRPPKVEEIMAGKIIGRGRSSIFVDLGIFGTGIIYGKEFYDSKDALKNLKIGDQIVAKIIDLENEDGYIELSLSGASKELSWEILKQKKENGEIITVKILAANKGGLLTEVSGIQAFLPVSQLSPEHYPRIEGADATKILKELQKFINKEMEVKIFDLDPKENKLILSEKAKEFEKIKEFLKNYKIGDVVDCEISGITDFGAFVKILPPENLKEKEKIVEIEGLIHISELDWQLIENPAEIIKIGERVKAKIIDISGDKVSLSLKALKKDPWTEIEKKYKKGDTVKGVVTKFNPFGAFVKITPEIQGLCHISEFGTKSKMEEKLKIGKKYDFQILEIRPEEHRMSLKLVSGS
jgi:small subunit ribosomal protein S1